jgi:hypothetical protein
MDAYITDPFLNWKETNSITNISIQYLNPYPIYTNKNSCKNKLYTEFSTQHFPMQHTHTHTHTHMYIYM